ncbi:MAG TPA: class I SAM-dependent methyltransferase [Usitatibacter sp.]|nr:class I SAM-dependent methyltransferase [Usitatibacter sp.]
MNISAVLAPLRSRSSYTPYRVALAAIFVVALWLRSGFGMTAMGDAIHDDRLFLEMARSLGNLRWLGAYDEFTLAKGAAFSVFAWLNYLTGLPLKFTEHAIYLGVSLFFASVLGRLVASRAATVACFLFLAFNPTFWLGAVGGRVVRENLYLTLALLVLALGARIFLVDRDLAAERLARERRRWLLAFGIAGAAFWLTREEGLWLAPSVAVLVGYWVADKLRDRSNRSVDGLRSIGKVLALALAGFLAVVLSVNAVNWLVYGVFRNNDFRSADFQGAYGALSRIQHDRWERFVLFPKDARERAYSVSPAARELKPFFEGDVGAGWRMISCRETRRSECPEILSGWFMWALRQSVTAAGHYKSAPEARGFYRRLAREINDACDRKTIPCGPYRATMIPPWHPSFVEHTMASAKGVYSTLVTLGGQDPMVFPSPGTPEQLAFFAKVTRSRPATEAWTGPQGARQTIATALARAEQWLMPILFPASVVTWLVLVVAGLRRRRFDRTHVLAACLFAAITMRIGLLSFMDATSMFANNILYLSPVVPELLAFVPCVAFMAFAAWRDGAVRIPLLDRGRTGMAKFHFVEDYEKLAAHLIATHPIDEAMALAVGGGSYGIIGNLEADILKDAGLAEGMRVVDLGCGSGRLASALQERGKYSYVGIDIIQSLLDYAQTKAPSYRFICHRGLSIPQDDATADIVSAFSLYTHLLQPEIYIYLLETVRILKPGGKAVFSFLEFTDPRHWTMFEDTVKTTRADTSHHLNMFLERSTIDLWAGKLGLVVERYFPGTANWNGHELGQAVAVLAKPR